MELKSWRKLRGALIFFGTFGKRLKYFVTNFFIEYSWEALEVGSVLNSALLVFTRFVHLKGKHVSSVLHFFSKNMSSHRFFEGVIKVLPITMKWS